MVIKSARPYGYFENREERPKGLRKLDLSVTFPIQWNVTSNDISKLLFDLGYETVAAAKENIKGCGRYGNRAVCVYY